MFISERSSEIDKEYGVPSKLQAEEELQPAIIFPEGGFRGWMTVFGASLAQFCTFGYTCSFGIYQGNHARQDFDAQPDVTDYYVRHYLTKYTPSEIGWIGGIQLFFVFALGIFTGPAFDRGYFHHLMISGALLYSFSFFMLSLSHENQYYQVFLSQGLGSSVASGLMYIPSLAVVSHYFQRHRPLAMGIVTAGIALGAVIHPIMLNKLFYGRIGFHNGVRISTAFNSVLLIIAVLSMRTRLPPKATGSRMPIGEFARDLPYLFVVLGGMLYICGLFFPFFFLQLYAVTHGVDRQFAFYCISILNAASVFGRTIPAIFVPKLGVVNFVTSFTVAMAIIIYCLGIVKDSRGIVAFAIFYGFFSGGGISFLSPMLSSLAKDIGEIGARIGVFFAFSGIIGLFATPIAGALLTSQFHWWRPIIFGGTTMIGSACLYFTARMLLVRRKGTQFV